ncbi:hypothetical protein ACHHYP_15450 [Achlya hypogyna]|uniref:Uncharacterized protein n=1 Tax=Achlya hypogyna TaxID=1202772 RepID=A0A1V9YAW7_ACHHY|nr:hypothetical protein ACHHYP_15450 [Achlya hypogyna]
MQAVLTSTDLLRVICDFQGGVYRICRRPWVHRRFTASGIGDVGASFHRDAWGISSLEFHLYPFETHFRPWYARHGIDGARRLMRCKPHLTPRVLDYAVRYGDEALLAQLSSPATTSTTINVAAYYGHLGVLQYLFAQGATGFGSACVHAAALRGHLAVVRFVVDNGVPYADEHMAGTLLVDAMSFAAETGQLAVVTYLYSHQARRNSRLALNKAVVHGHVAVVSFLCEQSQETCSATAIEFARRRGHTAVLAYLAARGIAPRDN